MAKSKTQNGKKKKADAKPSYKKDPKAPGKDKESTEKKEKVLLEMSLPISGYIYTLRVIDMKSRNGIETGAVYSLSMKLIEVVTDYGTVEGLPILYHELFEAVTAEFEHYYTSQMGRNVVYSFNHTEMYQIMQLHLTLLRTVLAHPEARKIFSLDQNLLDVMAGSAK